MRLTARKSGNPLIVASCKIFRKSVRVRETLLSTIAIFYIHLHNYDKHAREVCGFAFHFNTCTCVCSCNFYDRF